MKKKFLNKRIPSLLGLLFLAISVGMVSWFGKNYTELRGRASVEETPKNVQISNITDTSFTVSYTTEIKAAGAIAYARDPSFGLVALDDRDRESGKPSLRQVHYITLTQLEPGAKYYFAIQSGATTFLDNTQPYEITSALSKLGTPSSQSAITGTVNLPDGSIPLEGIAYVSASASNAVDPDSIGVEANPSTGSVPGAASQLLSVLLREDGSYVLPISTMRTKDLAGIFEFGPDTVLHMTLLNATDQSQVSLLATQTNPVPLITISKDYDFAINTESISNLTASESSNASPSGDLSPGDSSSASNAASQGLPLFPSTVASGPDILTPENDEEFVDQQPRFAGTALPNATVIITIESDPILQTSVQADDFGNWQFRPTVPLSPGEHVITIIASDASGVLQTIKRSFTVYAAGSQFNEPSIEPTINPNAIDPTQPTPTPIQSGPTLTPTPTINVTPISLPTPTSTASLSATPNLTLTISPTPNLTLTMAALSTTPDPDSLTATARATGTSIAPSGNYTLLFAGFIAVISVTAGFVVFFL